jgi:hypothetical protein
VRNFDTGTVLYSSSATCAAVFGVGLVRGNVSFSNWQIGQFAGEAMLTATAISSSYSWATLFGPANINNNTNNFSGWQISALTGEDMGTAFGGKATLTATATTSSSSFSSHYLAPSTSSQITLFGPANINGSSNNFSGWQIGQFAGEAELTAEAGSSSSYYSRATLFGPAHINNNTNGFSGWQIGAMEDENIGTVFGDHATLHAMANSSGPSWPACSARSISTTTIPIISTIGRSGSLPGKPN